MYHIQRHEVMLWSLVQAQDKLRAQIKAMSSTYSTKSYETSAVFESLDQILGRYATQIWQAVPIHVRLRLKLDELRETESESIMEYESMEEEIDEEIDHFADVNDVLSYSSEFREKFNESPASQADMTDSPEARPRSNTLATSSAVKKYKCTICKKRFLSNILLQNHIRTHTGEKPFDCPECNRKFSSERRRLLHVKEVHRRETRYICDIC